MTFGPTQMQVHGQPPIFPETHWDHEPVNNAQERRPPRRQSRETLFPGRVVSPRRPNREQPEFETRESGRLGEPSLPFTRIITHGWKFMDSTSKGTPPGFVTSPAASRPTVETLRVRRAIRRGCRFPRPCHSSTPPVVRHFSTCSTDERWRTRCVPGSAAQSLPGSASRCRYPPKRSPRRE